MTFNFKKAEEVEAYLKNIFIEYKFGCEKEKKAEACQLLGDYMEAITLDFAAAADIYKKNCDERNWARSCAKFGSFRYRGKGCTADKDDSCVYMNKACNLGDSGACVKAAILEIQLNHDNTNFPTIIQNSIKLLQKACYEYNDLDGCFFLSTFYLGALGDKVEKNFAEAYKLSLKCCEADNPKACMNVSRMYAMGEGVQKDESLAKLFKDRAHQLIKELQEAQTQVQFGIGIDT